MTSRQDDSELSSETVLQHFREDNPHEYSAAEKKTKIPD